MRKNNFHTFFPLKEIYTNFAEIEHQSEKFIQKNESKNIYIPEAPIIFPINFIGNLPLKAEFWDEPTQEFSATGRINNFLKPLENFRYYKLLVCPISIGKTMKPWATYCFNLNAKKEEIFFFMSSYYLSMDIRAKNAALYHFGNPIRYELKTKKKILIKNAASSKLNN